jgi:pseudaminic acid synthase
VTGQTSEGGAIPSGEFSIAGRAIGPGHPVYIVAEMSANHRQDRALAMELVHAAKDAGADAIKLQTYTPDTITIQSAAAAFRLGERSLWAGRTLHELYREAYTPWEWQPDIKGLADSLGLACFSSPFDASAVAFLVKMEVPAFKVASFELVDLPLIRTMAETGRPLIMSTGMATEAEIDEAMTAARSAGARDIALLKCTSAYPSPPEAMNLSAIGTMARRWSVPIGLSDHTTGEEVAVGAVVLGACIVEKHFKFTGDVSSPDAAFSLDEKQFARMVKAIRSIELAVGTGVIGPTPDEAESRRLRRSLFVVEDITAGGAITPLNIRSIRPGDGLHTREYEAVLGRRAARAISRGTPLSWDLLEPTADSPRLPTARATPARD